MRHRLIRIVFARLTVLVTLTSLWAVTAHAQITNLPPEVQQKMASWGPVLIPEMIAGTYAALTPLLKAHPRTGIKVTADVEYGPDPRQRLDLFAPAAAKSSPVVVFVPGGGYVSGNKSGNDVIYSNVGTLFARNGMLAITINYRIAPQHPWPAGAQDVGRVVAWAKANAAALGGDPARIFLFGHSAGATHVASYLFDPSLHPAEGASVAGAILVSGLYHAKAELAAAPNIRAYFGADASQYETRSPITHLKSGKVPLFIAMAEYDPPFLGEPSLELARLVCARDGKCPRFAWLKGHNHISELVSLDTDDHELSDKALEFIRATP